MKLKLISGAVALLLFACNGPQQEKAPVKLARENKENILKGWNTWDNRSILHQVYLPDRVGLLVRVMDGKNSKILELAFTGNRASGAEKVETIAHTPDGSYTDFTLSWHNIPLRVQTVSERENLYMRVMRQDGKEDTNDRLLIRNGFIYGDSGNIQIVDETIISTINDREFKTTIIAPSIERFDEDNLAAPLGKEVYITVGKVIPAPDIDLKIESAVRKWNEKKESYGKFAESYDAIQNAVNWTVVYDPVNNEPVIPVARPWAYGWGASQPGGWIRFCWDNFFVAYMQSMESKELAFSEAIEMCNYIDEYGMVPNFIGPFNLASRDRSQPPVGSMMVKEIYKAHPEEWFLEKTFDQLLEWNRWWPDNRDIKGYLAWGSNPVKSPSGDPREKNQNTFKAASYESGLDNTPMYDGVAYDTIHHVLEIGDVGLMSLYVQDCEALAEIADVLNKTEEHKELKARAEKYREKLKSMWNEDFGLFLNVHTDTGQPSFRISPTNFYALMAKAATQEQAERMIRDHFYNPREFWGEYIMPSIARNDTAYTGEDYWRGSIWAPMNFLVYYGMRYYDLPQARKDLSEKSYNLLMKEWLERGYIRENYNAETGGAPSKRSEHFYHWGALLGMINMIEDGYVPPIEQKITPEL